MQCTGRDSISKNSGSILSILRGRSVGVFSGQRRACHLPRVPLERRIGASIGLTAYSALSRGLDRSDGIQRYFQIWENIRRVLLLGLVTGILLCQKMLSLVGQKL